jgi:prepilin-type N-terminal cleavage/methylation domain-containing protein
MARRRQGRRWPAFNDDAGFGLIEVVMAISILAITMTSVGWLIISSLAVSNQAKQRATASGLIEQVDALFQTNIPGMNCTNAATYVTGAGSGTATRNGAVSITGDNNVSTSSYTVSSSSSPPSGGLLPITITVSWKPAATGQSAVSTTNKLMVQCQ